MPIRMRRVWGPLTWALALSAVAGQAALAETRVQLVTLDWPPYIGQSLPERGPTHRIVAEALAASGHTLQAEFLPWARAMEEARNARVVGIFPEYYDPSRDTEFVFSDPLPGGPIGLYKRRDHALRFAVDPRKDPEGAFLALREQRFGVVRGYVNTRTFDAAQYLIKEEATSDEINLKKLAYGRIDLVVIDTLVADYLLGGVLREFDQQLELMPPPLEYKPLYVAFSRAHPQMPAALSALNQGLAVLRATGRMDQILRDGGLQMAPSDSLTLPTQDQSALAGGVTDQPDQIRGDQGR